MASTPKMNTAAPHGDAEIRAAAQAGADEATRLATAPSPLDAASKAALAEAREKEREIYRRAGMNFPY